MNKYQIGRDISSLEQRLAQIESRIAGLAAPKTSRVFPSVPVPRQPRFTHVDLAKHAETHWQQWTPPFPSASVRPIRSADLRTGNIQTGYFLSGDGDLFDDAHFEFLHLDPDKGGRVQIHTEWWCDRSYRSLRLVDDPGPSTLILLLQQRVRFSVWKWQPDDPQHPQLNQPGHWAPIGNSDQGIILDDEARNYDVGQGGDDSRTWDPPAQVFPPNSYRGMLTDLTVEKGQWVSVQIGVYSHGYSSASNYTVNAMEQLQVRLDKAVVNVIA